MERELQLHELVKTFGELAAIKMIGLLQPENENNAYTSSNKEKHKNARSRKPKAKKING
ncbi:hypothetical protein ACI6Q2_10075 [Chitinophagaceae bacterium LWZ2-11]